MTTPPRVLLALDSGFPDLGAALYRAGRLHAAAWVRVPPLEPAPCPVCPRACEHGVLPSTMVKLADQLERDLDLCDLSQGDERIPEVTVVEWASQIFSLKLARARSRGLSILTGLAAMIMDRSASWGAQTYHFTPSDWKGSLRKPVHQARAVAMLLPAERALLPFYHNEAGIQVYRSDPLDAAALGLWWLTKCHFRELRMHGSWQMMLPFVEPDRRQPHKPQLPGLGLFAHVAGRRPRRRSR